jgi:soluble lytic murein transglycosylase
MGRAGYWLGRAHQAAGNAAAAAEAYALGARYQSSFYGQLAADRGGLPVDPAFLGTETYGDWRQAPSPPTRCFTPVSCSTRRVSGPWPRASSPI